MKLYTAKYVPNPLRVEIFIKEKGITDKIEFIEVELAEEAKGQEHLTRNLLGQVPVLELDAHGDTSGEFLSESRAICTYLEGVFPEPNLMGKNHREIAFIEMYDRQVEHGLLYPIMQWVRHTHPGLAKLESPQVPDWGKSSEQKVKRMIGLIDTQLEIKPYIAGNEFTIADITLYCALNFARIVKYKAWEEYENIKNWRETLLKRGTFD